MASLLEMSWSGGDGFLTRCAWEQGFAPTDPGVSLKGRNVRAFDPGQPAGKPGWRQGSYELAENLTLALTGKCEGACEVRTTLDTCS
jgi:hypothetical protein